MNYEQAFWFYDSLQVSGIDLSENSPEDDNHFGQNSKIVFYQQTRIWRQVR